ncbi:Hypothetical predicted protein [Octopus vulgaris]|uniref:Uncharacterized protein n=1 Tax=Octopus vulgaris TaxID=6645 RepID=A0AA36BCM8_OCTVU|nr:Hypothetical predicted protein [Octopus vulgaris]
MHHQLQYHKGVPYEGGKLVYAYELKPYRCVHYGIDLRNCKPQRIYILLTNIPHRVDLRYSIIQGDIHRIRQIEEKGSSRHHSRHVPY